LWEEVPYRSLTSAGNYWWLSMLPTVAVYASVAVMLLYMLLDTFAVKIKYVVSARVSEDESRSK